jgi:hypothetical protein
VAQQSLLFQWRKEILRAHELIACDRHTLHVIGFAMDVHGRDGFPSIRLIVEQTGYTKQTVLDTLAWVKEAAWIRAGGRSRYGTITYEPVIPTERKTRADRAAFMRDRRQASATHAAASPQHAERVASLDAARSKRRTTSVGLNGVPPQQDAGRSRTSRGLGLDGDAPRSRRRTTTSPDTSPSTSPKVSTTDPHVDVDGTNNGLAGMSDTDFARLYANTRTLPLPDAVQRAIDEEHAVRSRAA